MRKAPTTKPILRARARVLPVLESLGYRLAFGEPGKIAVIPTPTEQDAAFIQRCWSQITNELCERIIDGYPYDVGGEGQSTAKQT